ncbi:MAG: hypothetical protein KDA94_01550, partial [Acidimicrobiales bacterium]|nr:hypothetical protein [Acidimicrobiales bacterium]
PDAGRHHQDHHDARREPVAEAALEGRLDLNVAVSLLFLQPIVTNAVTIVMSLLPDQEPASC